MIRSDQTQLRETTGMDNETGSKGTENLQPVPPTFSQRVVALLARTVVRMIGLTLRIRILGSDDLKNARTVSSSGQVAFAIWHGHQFPPVYHLRKKGTAVLTSLSRDGSLQTLFLGGLGYHCIRGSSSHGAVRGLIGLIRSMKEGRDALFGVDGPHGPYHEVKPGIVFVAKKTGAAIVPIGIAVRKARIFEKAWDRYILPFPFTKVIILYGTGMIIPPETDTKTFDQLAEEIGGFIEALNTKAESLL
ncbi:lysophospholipid acyltransferase family protein [Gemmatimonadota bacterium]